MTATLKEDGTVELTIEREFNYPPQQIFEAWLDPQKLAIWMGPSDEIQAEAVKVNAVEGGAYSMQFNNEDGSALSLHGVYKTIQRYTLLVFTWIWEPAMDTANSETLVSVEFIPTDTGTRLRLVHQRFGSEDIRDRHHSGWEGTLDKLMRRIDLVLA